MSKYFRQTTVYLSVLAVFAALLILILRFGPSSNFPRAAQLDQSWKDILISDLASNLQLPITNLLIQLLVILLACRFCSFLFRALGQTKVIGEIFAGILLGKSVFAILWPEGFEFVFPEASMPRLYFLSQIGLVLFMFVVGLELNLQSMKKRASAALFISHASIVFPFVLGAAVSIFLYQNYAAPRAEFTSFALFMGIAMSITAFPVLARIIKEKNLSSSPLGNMALTCAAVDDITAWCILAAVIGIVKAGSPFSFLAVLALSAVYIFGMLRFVGPLLERKFRPKIDGTFRVEDFAVIFMVVLGSAVVAEVIGIHALFGAFLAGTIMPKSISFRANLTQRIEDISAVALLPLFFAYTGIRTQIGTLNTWNDWLVCGLIILVAVIGKLLGSALAAKYSGMNWRDSLSVGVLMNTRGLMELVVLNIGYDLGLLSPAIFSMMVIMAIFTTMMTSPLLGALQSREILMVEEEALSRG